MGSAGEPHDASSGSFPLELLLRAFRLFLYAGLVLPFLWRALRRLPEDLRSHLAGTVLHEELFQALRRDLANAVLECR